MNIYDVIWRRQLNASHALAKHEIAQRNKMVAEVERMAGKVFDDIPMQERIRLMDIAQKRVEKGEA
jgi:hypothetical protein